MIEGVTLGFSGLAAAVILMALRVPIGIALGGVALIGIWIFAGSRAAIGMIAQVPYDFTAHWTLSSIPMFLLMGYIAYYARITESIFKAAQIMMGRLPGGVGVASVAGAAGFSAVTGSSLAAAAAMGRIAIPEMERLGYRTGFAAAIVAAAGTIGSMIPPSIFMIVYGVFAEVSIGKLFVAGVIPGILTAVFYSAVIVTRAVVTPDIAPTRAEPVQRADIIAALTESWPFALLVFGVFGGLFSGVFTPTEAGAVGAMLATLIALVKRALTVQIFWQAVIETLRSTCSIFFIAIGAALLTRFLAFTGVPSFLSDIITDMDLGLTTLILAIALLYIFLGMFLDPLGCMLLTLPIILPILDAADANLIWFGILMVKFLEIGLITPPVGLNVFIIKGVVGDRVSIGSIFANVSWFILADLVLMVLLIVAPAIVLFLPQFID